VARVLIIGNLAASLINFRKPLLQALVAAGHDVIACSPEASPEVEEEIVALGVRFVAVPMARAGLNPWADLQYSWRLFRLMRQSLPDVVLTYTIKPNIYGSFVARICEVPKRYAMVNGLGYAFTAGEGIKRQAVRKIVAKLYKLAFAGVDDVIFQNADDRAFFKEERLCPATKNMPIVNGSGVDLSLFFHAEQQRGSLRFLMIARLLRDKGVLEYCEAARQVKAVCPEAEFNLVGPIDPNPSAIPLEYVHEWERDGIGQYLGEIRDIRPLLAGCSVYVLPSYREGTPRTVLEAMAVGRAVITTDAPGCKETVTEGFNGLKVTVADVGALVAAMLKMARDPVMVQRMGHNGRQLAEQKYDANKVAQAMMGHMGL
jgi:glycosyltransferase involved in cell wall biosynthesis